MKLREKICAWLFEVTKKPYAVLFKSKREGWGISSSSLLRLPQNTLGYRVGLFLTKNQIDLIPKLEAHDFYHVITGMTTSVKDEIGMQYLLLGNGKRGPYLFSTVGIGTMLLPEYTKYFIQCYRRGKCFEPIYQLNLKKELTTPLSLIRSRVRKSQRSRIQYFKILNDH